MNYNLLHAHKHIESFRSKLAVIRAGRVNSSVLDNVLVEAYDSHMHIKELATISIPEPSQIMITPFDKSLLKNLEKAITDSNLGVNPNNDGAGIRLVFPPLTEETRKQKTKEVDAMLEESRIGVRVMRQDTLKEQKHKQENDEISEDELRRFEADLQKEVDSLNKELEDAAKAKKLEITTL